MITLGGGSVCLLNCVETISIKSQSQSTYSSIYQQIKILVKSFFLFSLNSYLFLSSYCSASVGNILDDFHLIHFYFKSYWPMTVDIRLNHSHLEKYNTDKVDEGWNIFHLYKQSNSTFTPFVYSIQLDI